MYLAQLLGVLYTLGDGARRYSVLGMASSCIDTGVTIEVPTQTS